MSDGFEIERKFLIRYPDGSLLKKCRVSYKIEQIYLKTDGTGLSDRIRKRESADKTEYFHTRKKNITDIRRVEIENLISEQEYSALISQRDPGRNIIYKSRYCLAHNGKTFEIDIYPFWQDRAVMEIELEDEGEEVDFPDEIKIIREITEDKRYTNSSIAKEIPQDDLQE